MSEEEASKEGALTLAFLRELAHVSDAPVSELSSDTAVSGKVELVRDWNSKRFVLQRQLGSGAFGVVFEAHDRERNATVALKLMRRRDPQALLLFKQEFRTLTGMVHPNLVQFYELHSDGEQWFLTMELIRGRSFLDAVRTPAGTLPPFDEERLRDTLRQLAEGLGFLHGTGKLHRDIKPSNVMVAEGGRVVLLDFGLVTDMAEGRQEAMGAGTPRYMAPEQAAARPIGPAADWYSVGVMLYEALAGRPPYIKAPANEPPPPPSTFAQGVPEDLETLCLDLLAPAPEQRPSGVDVLERLAKSEPRPRPRERSTAPSAAFVGRSAHLRRLDGALADSQEDRTAIAFLHGPSGMGKSALANRFLEDLSAQGSEPERVVLSGRCFEQESVPYKMLDSLVDALCRYLRRLPRSELEALLPQDLGALARLFPVLGHLPGAPVAARLETEEPAQLRRRGAWALRALLVALARRGPLVLFIDDLQWGDLDSVALLLEVLRPPSAPALLLLASYRQDEADTSPSLSTLLQALRQEPFSALAVHDVEVGELEAAESEELMRALLGTGAQGLPSAPVLASEGRGSPFFLTELARYIEESSLPDPRTEASTGPGDMPMGLEAVIQARLQRLPEAARRLLEVISVAGQPLARTSASRAASGALGGEEELQALALLRASQLLRVRRVEGREELLPYHDRIREVVVTRLPLDIRRGHHRGLALALEESGHAELEQLVFHFREAGELPKSARYAVQAATRAHEVLAFDRAARLYRAALETGTLTSEEVRVFKSRLGEALTSAGRPREAAQVHLQVAESSPADRAFVHRRQAMEQLLLGGYIEEGIEVLAQVLREVGLSQPSTSLGALLSLVVRRLRLELRGFDFQQRPASALSEDTLRLIDTTWAVALGLTVTNPIRAADFQMRNMLLALEAGEPYRISRAMSLRALTQAFSNARDTERTEFLLRRARELAEQEAHPHALGMSLLSAGLYSMTQGDYRKSESLLREATTVLQGRCAGVPWELDFARTQWAIVLWQLGEVPRLATLVKSLIEDARERGNLHCETMVRLTTDYLVHLAADEPERARETLRTAMRDWPQRTYQVQHYRDSAAQVRLALYQGERQRALSVIRGRRFLLLRSGLMRVPALRIESRYWGALVELEAAPRGDKGVLRQVLRAARALEHERLNWAAAPFGTLLRAGVAWRQGNEAEALRWLCLAEEAARAHGMALIMTSIQRRRGELLGGDEGQALIHQADAWMARQSVRAPERLPAIVIPSMSKQRD
ncbi:serine/threonine-protein kinase [Hyalangium versicolor]|uniref:serine/threonine-protein kinase n=1 Tax=Hyalangium versicolor TaxID=2861190 RepID=UPI001CCEC8C8|nr:serine/threonine-protein kinase [Hyalangium versicolor]